MRGRLIGEIVEVGVTRGSVSAAEARALVHAPDAWGEVAVVRGQHQEDHRLQHCMSLKVLVADSL
jgi:hypothetical protein